MKALLTCSILFLFGCSQKTISDNELLKFATSSYDKEVKMNTEEILGVHNGHQVKVIYPCGDLCPTYTKRIVSYSIDIENCTSDIGVKKDIRVLRGRAAGDESFCLPKVLSENWENVVL